MCKAVPDGAEWSRAMTLDPITIAALAGSVTGLVVGAAVAGIACFERRSLRLPEELQHRLSDEAAVNGQSLRAEIIARLEQSLEAVG